MVTGKRLRQPLRAMTAHLGSRRTKDGVARGYSAANGDRYCGTSTPSLAGAVLYTQGALFQPGVNPLGLLTSNEVRLVLGTY